MGQYPNAFLTRARARLARTGLHLDLTRRSDTMAAIYATLEAADAFEAETVPSESESDCEPGSSPNCPSTDR